MKIFRKNREENTQSENNPADVIIQMFERRRINPQGRSILAIAFLYDRIPSPMVVIDTNTVIELTEENNIRKILTKILPGYQPHILPGHLRLAYETQITYRQFEPNESLDVNHINPLLAQMLVDALNRDRRLKRTDLSKCSAISISGNSFETGEARIALLVQ